MDLRTTLTAGPSRRLARQLGEPTGWTGRLVARTLNSNNRAMVAAACRAAQPPRSGTVADIGFGGGVGLAVLLDEVGEDGRVHGVEISDTMLDLASRRFRSDVHRGRLQLQRGSLTGLPLEDDSLDAALTVNTLYFVEDLPAAVAELARVLRPGGRVVLGVRDPTVMAGIPVTRHGFRLREPEEIEPELERAGLAVSGEDIGTRRERARLYVGTKPR